MTDIIHSLLFVPARDKMLAKIAESTADAYIIDLEDSIQPECKAGALEATVRFLNNTDGTNCFIRVDRMLMREQLVRLDSCKFRGVMVPKVEDCKFLEENVKCFENREVIALVETPLGLARIDAIASNPAINALAFGAEDYTAAVNMQNIDDCLLYPKSRLVMFGKAYGKRVYDTPSFCIQNVAQADGEAERAAMMGFDGKMIIHPKLIPGVQKAFAEHDIDNIQRVVAEYEKHGEAVAVLDGKVYEKMHIARFKRILKENHINL